MTISFHSPTIKMGRASPPPSTILEHVNGVNPCSRPRISTVLEDEASRGLLVEHKRYLRRLVNDGRDRLQSMGYFRSSNNHGSSLRTIVSGKLDRCNHSSILKLEADLTEATEDLSDFSEQFFDGNLIFDFEEQQRASDLSCARRLPRINSVDFDVEGDEDVNNISPDQSVETTWEPPVPVPATNRMIRITPDLSVPLRGAGEIWQAICTDSTVVTTCSCCQTELHVLQDAAYVVCLDCWVVETVEQRIGDIGIEMEEDADDVFGVALGIKSHEVLQWVD